MNAQATAIEHDGRGTATGVRIVVETIDGPRETSVRAATVVVSAGALETPRLVLVSGLGNDWVGRNHHSHGVAIAQAAAGPSPKSFVGPGHSVATVDWVHRNGEAWGGGVLFDLPPAFPVMKAQTGRTVAAAPYGRAHKNWMRETPPALGAMSMVQEIPSELARISADPRVKDRYGMPVARLRPAAHPASQVASDYMTDAAERWVRELGGEQITRLSLPGGSRGSEHSAGTARMGLDPATSATNERGLLWGTSNVYVADASLHPTNGGFNPALTAMACSLRVADLMVRG
jgi:choline dehydrogenase-like flavoprotein